MTDGEALLEAVKASPADDAPRLVYADWLDEHGEGERAEFIRVQCEIEARRRARMDTPGGIEGVRSSHLDDPRRHRDRVILDGMMPLLDQERNLLTDHATGWFEAGEWHQSWYGIGNVTNADRSRNHGGWTDGDRYILADFRRGFVASLTLAAADLPHLDAVLAAHPVEEVRLTSRPHRVSGVGRWRGHTKFDGLERADAELWVHDSWATTDEQMCRIYWPRIRVWHLPPEAPSGPLRLLRPNTRTTLRINGGPPIPVVNVVTTVDVDQPVRHVITPKGERRSN